MSDPVSDPNKHTPDPPDPALDSGTPIPVKLVSDGKKSFPFGVVTSLTTLALSVTAAIVALGAWMRGPQIDPGTPEMAYFFWNGKEPRGGPEDEGILEVAARLHIVNTAGPNYGDALMGAHIQFEGDARTWPVATVADISVGMPVKDYQCPSGSYCIRIKNPLKSSDQSSPAVGDALIPQQDEGGPIEIGKAPERTMFVSAEDDFAPITVPGGDVRTLTLAFPIIPNRCRGDEEACATTSTFKEEVPRLVQEQTEMTITLHMLRSGDKTVTCRLEKLQPAWLLERGYRTKYCETED